MELSNASRNTVSRLSPVSLGFSCGTTLTSLEPPIGFPQSFTLSETCLSLNGFSIPNIDTKTLTTSEAPSSRCSYGEAFYLIPSPSLQLPPCSCQLSQKSLLSFNPPLYHT